MQVIELLMLMYFCASRSAAQKLLVGQCTPAMVLYDWPGLTRWERHCKILQFESLYKKSQESIFTFLQNHQQGHQKSRTRSIFA